MIGTGTPASCTSAAVVSAIAAGGIMTFNCGPNPITITLDETAKIYNDKGPKTVIDGGGLVTLSGGGQRRILYMNTCDEALKLTTPHCANQDHPRVTLQNLTMVDGNSLAEPENAGGAVFVRGGQFKIVNCRFFRSVCSDAGFDQGGAAVQAYNQYDDQPVYIVNSTFGGAATYGGTCSNGGGVSSLHASFSIFNSLFSYNRANGAPYNGGRGGGVYVQGTNAKLSLCGTRIENNTVDYTGSGVFFQGFDPQPGFLVVDKTVIKNNSGGSKQFWYPAGFPITVTDSDIED